MIQGEDGQKMSKSRGNVINPDDVVKEYGADSFRLYEMFMGPLDKSKPWNTKGLQGCYRFLSKVWRLFHENTENIPRIITTSCAKAVTAPSANLYWNLKATYMSIMNSATIIPRPP